MSEFASGALLMNTCSTNIPYLLTAKHVTDGIDYINASYYFGWWSSTCTPNTYNQTAYLFNGANLVASNPNTDFSLLQLLQIPPSNYDITYLGWSRSSVTPSSSVGIHHPQGDQMKISFAANPASIGTINSTYPNAAWRVLWTSGIVEPGSSGSPLFDPNKKVVGQLSTNTQPIGPPCNEQTGGTNYGRFDLSWTGGGTYSTQLSYWLDPSNSGAMTTNTTNVSALITYPYMSISGADLFCSGTQTYTLNGAPGGATIFWSATPSNLATLTPHGTTVDVTKVGGGAFTLAASVYIANCYPATKIVHLGPYGSDDYPISGPSNANCNSYVTYTTNQLPGVTSYNWFYPSSWTYVSGQGTYSLTLRATGSNGNFQSSNPGQSSFSEINIYDEVGNLKMHKIFNKIKTTTLNVSNLPTGVYTIEIIEGSYKERKGLEILK
ncbi:MAG TPA: trypsin-like peptidase domain-containing protein [Hanamia sp.]|nr:trypsin-like peptidase domain-containing protein [Hanamia sp.]